MCDDGCAEEAVASIPRPVGGTAVDPIALDPVDEIVITTLMDNSYDALMTDMGPARRTPFARIPGVSARSSLTDGQCPGWWPSTDSRRW
jgi:7,8-dihydropterin-6-yl-methyl-4-(beta-D-ribofuranosyl)aminobenzene 5'-phosphate synthase